MEGSDLGEGTGDSPDLGQEGGHSSSTAGFVPSAGHSVAQAGLCQPRQGQQRCRRGSPASAAQPHPLPELVDGAVQSDDIITVSIAD